MGSGVFFYSSTLKRELRTESFSVFLSGVGFGADDVILEFVEEAALSREDVEFFELGVFAEEVFLLFVELLGDFDEDLDELMALGAAHVGKAEALEDENRRLKKLLAESMLDASTLKEMLGKNF